LRIHTFYRLSVWLPLVPPAVLVTMRDWFGPGSLAWLPQDVVELLLVSFLYGGMPYALLAVWATWWIDHRPEPEIRRLILRAPFLMVATFVTAALVVGFAVGRPAVFLTVGVLGAIVSIPLGYAYAGVVVLLRMLLGRRLA
jgi:hypothetical protein